jgi:hypothetical protein
VERWRGGQRVTACPAFHLIHLSYTFGVTALQLVHRRWRAGLAGNRCYTLSQLRWDSVYERWISWRAGNPKGVKLSTLPTSLSTLWNSSPPNPPVVLAFHLIHLIHLTSFAGTRWKGGEVESWDRWKESEQHPRWTAVTRWSCTNLVLSTQLLHTFLTHLLYVPASPPLLPTVPALHFHLRWTVDKLGELVQESWTRWKGVCTPKWGKAKLFHLST